MSAGGAAAGSPPVDGEWLGGMQGLLRELRPAPGRLANTVRLVALVVLAVTIAEVFRIPDPGVCAYVVLFVSRGERTATVKTAIVAGLAAVAAVFATIAVFAISLSEPAFRVPLIALVTFAAMALSRASKLGPVAFAVGFIIAYGLTIGDEVLGVALQGAGISDTTGPGVPALLTIPPEEALVQTLLWLALVAAMPMALVVVGNLLTGHRALDLLRRELSARLAACAGFCAGDLDAPCELAASVRDGRSRMAPLLEAVGRNTAWPNYRELMRETEQAAIALLTQRLLSRAGQHAPLAAYAAPLAAASRRLSGDPAQAIVVPESRPATDEPDWPILDELARATTAIAATFSPQHDAAPSPAGTRGALFSADKLRSPETLRFATKVTLAVMLSYVAETLLDWPAIHTCVVTCFFVSLGTLGESLQKAGLRIVGALIGGALGIATILLLMPLMTDLGDLLVVVTAVTFLAGWVSCGSERISYAGWQIGIAFYLTVLQGYGPTLDMQTGRDRIIGVLLGNMIVLLVFSTIWPVHVMDPVRRHVAVAIAQIVERLRGDGLRSPENLQACFITEMSAARRLLANVTYEPAGRARNSDARAIDAGLLAGLETVMLIAIVIDRLNGAWDWQQAPEPARRAALAYENAVSGWLACGAARPPGAIPAPAPQTHLPEPPCFGDSAGLAARVTWYSLLDTTLRRMPELATLDTVSAAAGAARG